jgi:hypothetical protein
MVALLQNRQGMADVLQVETYIGPALVPASPWLESGAAQAPTASVAPEAGAKGLLRIRVEPGAASKATVCWAVWLRYGVQWVFQVSHVPAFTVPVQPGADTLGGTAVSAIVISAIDRVGKESPRTTLNLSQIGL